MTESHKTLCGTKSSSAPDSLNEISSEYRHADSSMYCQWLPSHHNGRAEMIAQLAKPPVFAVCPFTGKARPSLLPGGLTISPSKRSGGVQAPTTRRQGINNGIKTQCLLVSGLFSFSVCEFCPDLLVVARWLGEHPFV